VVVLRDQLGKTSKFIAVGVKTSKRKTIKWQLRKKNILTPCRREPGGADDKERIWKIELGYELESFTLQRRTILTSVRASPVALSSSCCCCRVASQ